MGRSPRDEPLTLTRCHSCGLPQLYEALEGGSPSVAESTLIKGMKRKTSFFQLRCFSNVTLFTAGCVQTLRWREEVMYNK